MPCVWDYHSGSKCLVSMGEGYLGEHAENHYLFLPDSRIRSNPWSLPVYHPEKNDN